LGIRIVDGIITPNIQDYNKHDDAGAICGEMNLSRFLDFLLRLRARYETRFE